MRTYLLECGFQDYSAFARAFKKKMGQRRRSRTHSLPDKSLRRQQSLLRNILVNGIPRLLLELTHHMVLAHVKTLRQPVNGQILPKIFIDEPHHINEHEFLKAYRGEDYDLTGCFGRAQENRRKCF